MRECSPPRHETVREEERQVSRRATLFDHSTTISIFFKGHYSMPAYMCIASSSLPAPIHNLGDTIRTQRTARNTSVTLNLRSTLHGFPASEPSLVARSNSPRNVNAQRRPHHPAGAVLSARQKSRGKCQRLSTPRSTATEGSRRGVFSRVDWGYWRASERVLE